MTYNPANTGFALFDSRDITSDGAVSSWDDAGGRNTIAQATSGSQPSKGSGVVSFDGNADILKDTTRGFGTPTSYDLGPVWLAQNTLSNTAQFTNTGITRAPNGTWWIVNHPAGDSGRSDGILVNFSADFSTILDEIDLGSVYGTGTIGGPQGVVYDTDDDTLWFTSALADEIKHVTLAGAEINDAISFPNPAGLAIDQANGTLIILESEGSASNKSAGVIRTVNKSTGATVASGTLTDMPDWDQIFFDQDSRALFITAGYEYADLGDTYVGIYNMDGANYLNQIAYIREPTATAIEGIVYHDGKLYICNDGGFHTAANGGTTTGLNQVFEYDVGNIVGSRIMFAAAAEFQTIDSTEVVMGLGNPISSDAYGMSLIVGGPTNIRLFARSAASGGNTNTTFSTSVPNLTTTKRIVTGVFEPGAANDARMWIDGTEVTGSVTGGALNNFTGPLTDRVRLTLGGAQNDAGTEERFADVDIDAIMYGIFNDNQADEREEIEGWLAHEFSLTGNLPAAHPYKSTAPVGAEEATTSGSLSFVGAAVASVVVTAAAAGALSLTGGSAAAISTSASTFSATGLLDIAGTASADALQTATAAGGIEFTGTADTVVIVQGSASGAVGLAGAAQASTEVTAAASGAFGLTALSEASAFVLGSGLGAIEIAGTATALAVAPATATALGAIEFTGVARIADAPITLQDIETAVGKYLESMGDTPIAWPNRHFTPDGIYIEFRHNPVSVEDPVISGGHEYRLGLFLITVASPAGEFSNEANALSEQILQRFPKALRLSAGGGNVVINAAPVFGTGFQDGSYWRQPIRISYITEGGTGVFALPPGSSTSTIDVSPTTDGIEQVGDNLRLDIDALPLAPEA